MILRPPLHGSGLDDILFAVAVAAVIVSFVVIALVERKRESKNDKTQDD